MVTFARRIVLGLLGLTVIGTSGCGSLLNPYLQFGERPSGTRQAADGSTVARQIPLGEAINYAGGVKDAYRKAIGGEAAFDRLLGVGLITVATALPIKSLDGASTRSLGVLGLSGAGTYALGAWLQSDPRQRAYILGYNAVNCAVEAVLPLAFDREQGPYKAFLAAMATIDTGIGAVETAIRVAESVKDLEDTGTAMRAERVAAARAAQREARTARQKGIEAQVRVATAGSRLTNAVDRIIGEVDVAVQANTSGLSTLTGIIGGLGGIYGEFPGAPVVSVFGDSGSELEAGNLATLSKTTAELASATLAISSFVALLSHVQPVETLRSCGVNPEAIVTAMTVEPDSASFSGARQETRSFRVRGGAFPYLVSLRGADPERISIDQPVPFGPDFTITVQPGTPGGLHAVHIADGSRRTASLSIDVSGAGPNADDGDKTDGALPASGAGGPAAGQASREAVAVAAEALLDQTTDIGDAFTLAISGAQVVGDETSVGLSVTIELTPIVDAPAPTTASAIRQAILALLGDLDLTEDHIRIANLDGLVAAGLVSGE